MNYLVHALITKDHPKWSVGNIITDLLLPKEVKTLDSDFRKGVEIHRAIDRYSDKHERVKHSISMVRSYQHKYAPVAVDLLYDHLLASAWNEHSSTSFQSFVHATYQFLSNDIELIPSRIRPIIKNMVEVKWLDEYRTEDGFKRVLSRMDRRASFPSKFKSLLEDCTTDRDALEADFRAFIPELQERMQYMMNTLS